MVSIRKKHNKFWQSFKTVPITISQIRIDTNQRNLKIRLRKALIRKIQTVMYKTPNTNSKTKQWSSRIRNIVSSIITKSTLCQVLIVLNIVKLLKNRIPTLHIRPNSMKTAEIGRIELTKKLLSLNRMKAMSIMKMSSTAFLLTGSSLKRKSITTWNRRT